MSGEWNKYLISFLNDLSLKYWTPKSAPSASYVLITSSEFLIAMFLWTIVGSIYWVLFGSCMNETKEPDPHLFWLLLSHTKLVQMFEAMRWTLPIYQLCVWNYAILSSSAVFYFPEVLVILEQVLSVGGTVLTAKLTIIVSGKGWRSLLRFDCYLVLPSSSTALCTSLRILGTHNISNKMKF